MMPQEGAKQNQETKNFNGNVLLFAIQTDDFFFLFFFFVNGTCWDMFYMSKPTAGSENTTNRN